mgnify:CR=1 FL=1
MSRRSRARRKLARRNYLSSREAPRAIAAQAPAAPRAYPTVHELLTSGPGWRALLEETLRSVLRPAVGMYDELPAMIERIGQHFHQLQHEFGWLVRINKQVTNLTGPSRRIAPASATAAVVADHRLGHGPTALRRGRVEARAGEGVTGGFDPRRQFARRGEPGAVRRQECQ